MTLFVFFYLPFIPVFQFLPAKDSRMLSSSISHSLSTPALLTLALQQLPSCHFCCFIFSLPPSFLPLLQLLPFPSRRPPPPPKPPLSWTSCHFPTTPSTCPHAHTRTRALTPLHSLSGLAFPGVNQACPQQPLPFHLQHTLTFSDTLEGREQRHRTLSLLQLLHLSISPLSCLESFFHACQSLSQLPQAFLYEYLSFSISLHTSVLMAIHLFLPTALCLLSRVQDKVFLRNLST